MAHYALIDENNIVTQVVVGPDENTNGVDWEQHYTNMFNQTCKRTSYNTKGNQHLENGTPFRGNYAGPGYVYDSVNDVFYAQSPGDNWVLNTETWLWEEVVE